MPKDFESILFATNFSENCRHAFEVSFLMACRYNAKLVLAYIIESKLPVNIEGEIKSIIGEAEWEKIQKEHENDARQNLIGKMTSNNIAKFVLHKYSNEIEKFKNNSKICKYETVVAKGDVANSILNIAENHKCDVIVMGARNGFLKSKSLGSTLKQVMRNSKVPVIFVPPYIES